MPYKRDTPRDVIINRRVTRPLYDATQRWMAENNKNLTDTIEQALLGLPGITPLYEEESEAYEKERNQIRDEFTDEDH